MKLSINGLRFPCADICDWSNEGSSEGRGNTTGTISVTRESSETGMSFVRKKALQCLTSFLWPPCIRITFLLCMWKRITFKICVHNELQRHCFVHVFFVHTNTKFLVGVKKLREVSLVVFWGLLHSHK